MRWDVIQPEDVASARTFTEQVRAFARYCQQVVGTPMPTSTQWPALSKRCKAFFIEYPQADWFTLCRVAQWCRNRKLRVRTTVGLISCFRSAWGDGALPELDPQNVDLELEREIERALATETDEEWRRRLILARGPGARREALAEWNAYVAAATTPTSEPAGSGAPSTPSSSKTKRSPKTAMASRGEIIVLDLGLPPSPPLSINEERRMAHWGSRLRRLDPWKDTTIVLARQERIASQVNNRPARVQLIIPFRTKTRRDPHNYVGTNVKACIDGLIKAGVWPDDTAEWVQVVDPLLIVGADKHVLIEIEVK